VSAAELAALFDTITRHLGLRTEGYRRVRGTVEKRLRRRLAELGLPTFGAYEAYLGSHPEEWAWVEPRCRITISRFARDRAVYERLVDEYLPARAAAVRARGEGTLRVWSAGTASGEEAYGLAIAWELALKERHPELSLEVLGTDADPLVLARAERGIYPAGCLRELPAQYVARAFVRHGQQWALRESFRSSVRFARADLRAAAPAGPFELVMCRNLAFTYFSEPLQLEVAAALAKVLAPNGVLMIGQGERVPPGSHGLERLEPCFYAAQR